MVRPCLLFRSRILMDSTAYAGKRSQQPNWSRLQLFMRMHTHLCDCMHASLESLHIILWVIVKCIIACMVNPRVARDARSQELS